MITQWQTSASQTAYQDLRFDFLKRVEDTRTLPYLDSKQIPTVGVGFNLRDSNVRQEVFKAMKIDISLQGLTPAQQAAEQGYIDLLVAAINLSYASGQNNILRPNLDAVMFNRAHDPLLQGLSHIAGLNTFEMNSTQMRTTVDALMLLTYENNVNAWLSGIPESNERAALVSLAYNSRTGSTSLLGSKLKQAILDDKRAEAWFEIRYNSNRERITDPTSAAGIAKRRFYEAEVFSLYSPGTTSIANSEVEAKAVFRMYTEHREDILTYESRFGMNPGGTPGQRNMIDAANNEYSLTGSAQVDTLSGSLDPAKKLLVKNFAQFTGAPSIDGEVLVGNDELRGDVFDVRSTSIPGVPSAVFDLSKNDLQFGEGGRDTLHGQGGADVLYGGAGGDDLYGDQGNDFLFGEAGEDTLQGGAQDDTLDGGANNDRLVGGTGDDLLMGGAGFDTYLYTTGDGHDRIEDSDASGVIIVNGKPLAGGVKKAGHTDWISADGTLKYLMSGTDLLVKLNDVTILTVNENFQSGQFNIKLIDAPTISTQQPSTTRTIVGDFDPLDTDPAEPGIQIDYDELGNFIQDTESPNDRSDLLNGSAGNDTINGGAMNDRLTALGGNDIGICFWLG